MGSSFRARTWWVLGGAYGCLTRKGGVRCGTLEVVRFTGSRSERWHGIVPAAQRAGAYVLSALISMSLTLCAECHPSTQDVARFRIFGATLGQMPGWSTDLQQASELGSCAWKLQHKQPRKLSRALMKGRFEAAMGLTW